ncbi:MAG TPA: hypothetical protein DEU95_09355 [Chloroflexi bacterium]|jgi:catechol 2,3-dioxygenase-like lactoylglutathione lyase family enzyme|nr:hypothetical protein [Chloroflexota bacterium]
MYVGRHNHRQATKERTGLTMPSKFRLEHVAIPAHGALFEETVNFYHEMFGMQMIRDVRGNGQHFAFLSDGQGGVIEVLDVPGPPLPAPSHLAFMVPLSEFEATHDRLAEQGIAFDPIVENTSGDLIAYFRDPAENTAQLIGRKDPLGH